MKNVSEFLPTVTEKITDQSGRVLQLQVDLDFKHDKINRILFNEGFDQKSQATIAILENEIQNISPLDSLTRIQELNLPTSTAFQLYLKFVKEYMGVVQVAGQSNILCPCKNFSRKDFEKYFSTNGFKTLAEFNAETLVGIDCQSCNLVLKNQYVDLMTNQYKENIPHQTIDPAGKFISFQGSSYGEVLGKINGIYLEFINENNLSIEDFSIVDSEGFYFSYKSKPDLNEKHIKAFQNLVFNRLGLLIFLDRAL